MTGPFQIHESVEGGRPVVCPAGELDLAEVRTLSERLRELLKAQRETILDLSQLTFIDSSGIRLLLEITRDAKEGGYTLRLRSPAPVVRDTLRLAGVLALLGLE